MTGEHNLALLADQALARHGDRDSVYFEGRWYRSGALSERAHRISSGLRRLGVTPGDRVVVLMANSPDVGVCYNALWRAGAVITPAMFLLTEAEIRHILESSGAVALITSPDLAERARAAGAGVSSLRWIITGDAPVPGLVSLDELAAEPPGEIVRRDDHDLAALMYTGGTTGRAKGVMLSHENLWYCARGSYDAGFQPGINRSLVPLPLSHSFGLIVTVVGMHAREAGIAVLLRRFDPTLFLEQVQEHRIQVAAVVPSMLQVLRMMPLEDYDLSSLRFFVSGAAPLPPEVCREIEERIPSVRVREGYGLTESGAVVATNPPDRIRRGSVGIPLPGYEVRIVDPEGREVAPGEAGEICCRAPGVMQGYWQDPELTAEVLRDGWLHTGDIGRMDPDGFLHIVDRKKDLVIRGGFNIYPRDVEDVLLEHPAVGGAAVIGRPDERLGEEVVAFVSIRSGETADPDELIEFARSRLGAHKYPREVHIVDLIPLTPVGKVDRKSLRQTLASRTATGDARP